MVVRVAQNTDLRAEALHLTYATYNIDNIDGT